MIDALRVLLVRMSFGAVARDDRFALLRLGQRLEQRACEVLFRGQRPRALAGTVLNVGRVRAEKRRRRAGRFPARDRPVLRDVMPLIAPAPGLAARVAEDREEVQLRGRADAEPSIARRTISRLRMVSTLVYPFALKPARSSANAALRWSSFIALSESPWRSRGMKCQLNRSSDSKGHLTFVVCRFVQRRQQRLRRRGHLGFGAARLRGQDCGQAEQHRYSKSSSHLRLLTYRGDHEARRRF